jgi:hypothetical protein
MWHPPGTGTVIYCWKMLPVLKRNLEVSWRVIGWRRSPRISRTLVSTWGATTETPMGSRRQSPRPAWQYLLALKAELIHRDPLADEILTYVLSAAQERAERDPEGLPTQIARATWQLMRKYAREPTLEEIAQAIHLPVNEVRQSVEATKTARMRGDPAAEKFRADCQKLGEKYACRIYVPEIVFLGHLGRIPREQQRRERLPRRTTPTPRKRRLPWPAGTGWECWLSSAWTWPLRNGRPAP